MAIEVEARAGGWSWELELAAQLSARQRTAISGRGGPPAAPAAWLVGHWLYRLNAEGPLRFAGEPV